MLGSRGRNMDGLLDAGKLDEVSEAPSSIRSEQVMAHSTDIQAMVDIVKSCTTLFDVDNYRWPSSVILAITHFIENPNRRMLCIYFDDDVLKASLDSFPTVPCHDMTWFRREDGDEADFPKDDEAAAEPSQAALEQEPLTPLNFLERIKFGTINNSTAACSINVLGHIYAPAFAQVTNWPSPAKRDIAKDMHGCLTRFTDKFYQMCALTVIYLPLEVIDMEVMEASRDEDLILRLEVVLVHWIHQVRHGLDDATEEMKVRRLLPLAVYDFWVHRYTNLAAMRMQMKCDLVKKTISILRAGKSSYVVEYENLMFDIEHGWEVSTCAIQDLQVLKEICNNLTNERRPKNYPKHIEYVLHAYRGLWDHSEFFHSSHRMTSLCHALSNQIISQCTEYLDMTAIFQGKSLQGERELKEIIYCCMKYKQMFREIEQTHVKNRGGVWDVDLIIVFYRINVFIRRCQDMLDICNCMTLFSRMDKVDHIPYPRYGGTHGSHFERTAEDFDKPFRQVLRNVFDVRHTILDVDAWSWYGDKSRFRLEMKRDVGWAVESLMTKVFEEAVGLEEGIDALQGMYYFAKHRLMKKSFQAKVVLVNKLLLDEIECAKRAITADRELYPIAVPHYAGRAMLAVKRRKKIERLVKIVDSTEWMTNFHFRNEVFAQYDRLCVQVEAAVSDYHYSWVLLMAGGIFRERLNRTLLQRSHQRPGLLEPNFDRPLVLFMQEVDFWDQLKCEVPSSVLQLHVNWEPINVLYERVIGVALNYNKIIAALSDDERMLFQHLIRTVDRKIILGITRLHWSTEVADLFIVDAAKHTYNLEEFVGEFKDANLAIVRVCEEICSFSLIGLQEETPPDGGYVYEDLKQSLSGHRLMVAMDILNKYNSIIKNLIVVIEGFADQIPNMDMEWSRYIFKMDHLLEDALKLCVRGSISAMYELLHGQQTTGAAPLISISICLIDKKLCLKPQLADVANFVKSAKPDLVKIFAVLPRIASKFKVNNYQLQQTFQDVLKYDIASNHLQHVVNTEMKLAMEKMITFVERWREFKDVWSVNKDMFMLRYEKLNPSSSLFDSDITKYSDLAYEVRCQPATVPIHFMLVNNDELKESIIAECTVWQRRLTELLLQTFQKGLLSRYEYIRVQSEVVMREPETLLDLPVSVAAFEALKAEVPEVEEELNVPPQQFHVLTKYGVEVEDEWQDLLHELPNAWRDYCQVLDDAEEMLTKKKDKFRTDLVDAVEGVKEAANDMVRLFDMEAPFTSAMSSVDALKYLQGMRENLLVLKKREAQIREDLASFMIAVNPSPKLQQLEQDIASLEAVWRLANKWDNAWDSYKSAEFWTINTDEMDEKTNNLFRKLTRLSRELRDKNWEIVNHTRQRVDNFRRTLPLITDLKSPALRDRHWTQVKQLMKIEFDQNSTDFTLESIIRMKMMDQAEGINDISSTAALELTIEQGLQGIETTWGAVELEMVPAPHRVKQPKQPGEHVKPSTPVVPTVLDPFAFDDLKTPPQATYTEKEAYRMVAVDDIFQTLEENQMALSSMKATRFVEPFARTVDYWERTLSYIMELLELFLNVQRQFLYLENIFGGDDIRSQLPHETEVFELVTNDWCAVTCYLHATRNVFRATQGADLLRQLDGMNRRLEDIQRAIEEYLAAKRFLFPRFYFVSNDDLLEILAQSNTPEKVQPHLKKCFDNINRLKIIEVPGRPLHGMGMLSADGEYIEFVQGIPLHGSAEVWLTQVETVMRLTLHDQLRLTRKALRKALSKRDNWARDWPGQMCITASQIQWTSDCTRTLAICKSIEEKRPLRSLRKQLNKILQKYSEAIRGTLSTIQRLKVVALVTIEIHARDVVDNLYRTGCTDMNTFDWLAQLRFYWDRDIDDCIIKQTNTCFGYGYEYLGNTGRLVITPLTDRCYITLTTALHLNRGGSPKGPAGTGKTETVKDLGKGLGMYVIVINCSEGLDYRSMGRMFSGLAQTGAWGCFDEFNRINIEVLSVVAQQILSILSALASKLTRFSFEGTDIKLVDTCGIFITMNPGYAGRTELPDNLKSMFRPISMIVPDVAMIAEITLFGEGYKNTRVLAKKVHTLFQLAVQQLSKQDHYDFGLRGMVSLLRYAGRKRRANPLLPHEEVILLSMKDMNVAKLTAEDLPLFNGIMSDLFPGINTPTLDYEELSAAIYDEFRDAGLQPIAPSVTKVIQLYETKNSRHSVMIVGKTGSGKSTTWKILRNSLSRLKKANMPGYNAVKEYPINPKALSLGELYGEFNLSTNEWLDGVLSAIMRKTCAEETPDQKWIVFDGPVDAVWIENMNSVMDDNKVLTLINSERIVMPEEVSLLFEVEDLAVASPATVSRCGMVYNDYKDLGWQPYVNSWMDRQESDDFVREMRVYFSRFVDSVLEFKRLHCRETVPVAELSAVVSLCKMLNCLATKKNGVDDSLDKDKYEAITKCWFLFCFVWTVCASVDEDGRKKLDLFVREKEGTFPLKDTIYDYSVDLLSRCFVLWEVQLVSNWHIPKGMPFFKIIVPTVDTLRYRFLVSALLENGYPGLLVGPVGTGKTLTALNVLESLDNLKYCVLMVNMSAQTTSNNVQDMIESRVEKRTKGVYVPAGDKTLVVFMDDLNMPAKETYGSQPPLELIRQWIDYGFWYDRQKQDQKYVKLMLLLAAMGPPGGGRNVITNRLLSRFNVINMTFPNNTQIERIFVTMLEENLPQFNEEMAFIYISITKASIEMYKNVTSKMLPTPTKTHYLFNLRDISKIFQGILRGDKEAQDSKTKILRLWVHECSRTFSDRLIDEIDQEWFIQEMNDQLGKHFNVTYNSICHNKEAPIFCDFVNNFVYEEQNVVLLRQHIEKCLLDYNTSPGVVRMDLVLFKDALSHICRIVRVISQPRGNMLLVGIGGSGRQSMARLAAFISEYSLFQIEVTKNYRVKEFREDMKALYKMSGVELKPTTFLFNDTQIADEGFLEIINNVLSSGEVPNLYKTEEFDEIKNLLQKAADKKKVQPTREAMFSFLIDRVRENLHIILCMSPVGDSFRNRLRQYPSLVNCTTIDWFHEWPQEALLEVAHKYLSGINFLETLTPVEGRQRSKDFLAIAEQERLTESVASIFALIHDSVSKCSRKMMLEMKRPNYVTPTNYLELVAGFKGMLQEKRLQIAGSANKLRNGLFKIDDTREKVALMAIELEEAQVLVGEYQMQCDEYLVIIKKQSTEADEKKAIVAARSIKIEEEEVACQKLADAAQADLNEAMPALEEAMRALDALNKKDLTEIRSYGRPPPKVEMVMEAVMIMKKVEPSWTEAKRQLGEQNFLKELREFDKDNISDRTLKRIGHYTRNVEFEPEKVGIVSLAAKSLCLWVIAIEKYGKLYRIVAPKRARLDEAMAFLIRKQQSLAEAKEQLVELALKLVQLQKEYDEKMEQKEQLRLRAETLEQKLIRAGQLVDGLAGEKVRWEATVATLDRVFLLLPGDCLIATAFISYLGPFVTVYRDTLVELWKKNIVQDEVPMSAGMSMATFLSDPTSIREWNIQGLPSDEFSTENGIIVTRAMRWPLLIDPQCQGVKWIRNMEATKGLKVIDLGQRDFMKTMESSIQLGHSLLLQNVMEELDPSLGPVLNRAFVKQGGAVMLKINDKLVTYHPQFRFFITTKLGNPHFAPEVSTKTTLVNFAVKEQGLEAQLLGIVVRKEKPVLEEQKDSLVMNIATGKRQLLDLEDELLRLLNETKGSLLDDLELLITLQTSKATSVSVTRQLEVAEVTEVEIDEAREGYRPCAQRASILFFVVNDMSRIDPMYQFSLDAYITLFLHSILKSKKSEKLVDRIYNLNDYHTYSVYRNTCRGLFEKHKLLFSFHMTVKILQAQGIVNPAEYNFLLKGGVVLDRQSQVENPSPTWMTDLAWDCITELDKVSGFHGIVNTFQAHKRDWHRWYTHKTPENQPLMGEWDANCTEFQRMLIVRSLRMDRIPSCVAAFVSNTLHPQYVDPPVLDLRAVLDDSSTRTPLIFVLSPGVDPTGQLVALAESCDMIEHFHCLSLGQGQAPIATQMIRKGCLEGNWVFLANCHLSLSWMPKLGKLVDAFQIHSVHPRFRLWLSSSPAPEFPISILQAGIKMTTEPPKGLKPNLKRLYALITDDMFVKCESHVKYRRLLFSLCFFHAVLLERKKFQKLGWNVDYSFNDSDFLMSESLLSNYLDEYEQTPWDALKYLIADVNYGGHVTDDWDRRLLNTYINQYFCDNVLTITSYRLGNSPTYYVPNDGSLLHYIDYVIGLPSVDEPEAFGQHSNADITSLISETRTLFETLMSLQVQVTQTEGDTKEEHVLKLSADVLSKVPEPIDYEKTDKMIGNDKSPLDVVLLQEIARYNRLLVTIRSSLGDLQNGIRGLVVMSSYLEDVFVCISEGRVPQGWLKAYPSLKSLGSWTRDLCHRVEHFSAWAKTTHAPQFFWLSAFTFPTGFLTAVLQVTARQSNISIDSLTWDFHVFSPDERFQGHPTDGVYVRGLYLEGAGWDSKVGCLTEPQPMQLVCSMPVVHFKPVEPVKRKQTNTHYVCPTYYYPMRCGAPGRPAFVVEVELKTGLDPPEHWIKRATALMLSLAE